MHQLGVGQRNQRVVFASHDQRWLGQAMQPVHAGPTRPRHDLQVVAEGRLPAQVLVHLVGQVRVSAELAAVNVSCYVPGIALVHIAPRGGHFPQHRWRGRNHQHAGRSRAQDQSSTAVRMKPCEFLGDTAAPGNAEYVGTRMIEVCEDLFTKLGYRRHAVWKVQHRRATDPRHVEDDQLTS